MVKASRVANSAHRVLRMTIKEEIKRREAVEEEETYFSMESKEEVLCTIVKKKVKRRI
jgi:hypothetical protein